MAKRLKRAFTIVELVIVIAVIAILAAVLIPTFTTLIDKANESNDIALVKNLNTALVSKEATDEVNTMQDALDAAYEYGYTVDKLTPSSSGDIVWDEVNNRFALINEKKEVVFEDGAKPLTRDATKTWKIVTELKGTQDCSWYVGGLSKKAIEDFKFTMGVDTGSVEADVNYASDSTQNVTIRTAGGTLTVDAKNATVNHYGTAQSVDVQEVAEESYHEYEKVTGNLTITKGHVVFESTAVVNTFVVAGDATTVKATVNDKAQVLTAVAKDSATLTDLNLPATVETVVAEMDDLAMFAGGAGTEKSPYQIATAEQFRNIGSLSNSMKGGKDYSFKLLDNIDLNSISFEENKVGEYFRGTFDGNGKQLIANNELKYIFMDAIGSATFKALDYKLLESNIQLCSGMSITEGNQVKFDGVDISTVESSSVISLGKNEGLYTNFVGYSNAEENWSDQGRNTLTIENSDVTLDINGISYNGVFIGGGANNTDVIVKNCTYTGDYYGEKVNLVQGNSCSDGSSLYGNSTVSISNIKNLGGLYGTMRIPMIAAGDASKEPSIKTVIENCDLGIIRELKDDALSIAVDGNGNLVITQAKADASYYVLTFTGGKRRISEVSENSSYRFSIKLSAKFEAGLFDTNYKDGKMATVEQYKQCVDSNATFDDSKAISLYDEEGAKVWIVEKDGTVYYVFDFADDYYFFANNEDQSEIVNINKAAVTIYDGAGLPVAQKECSLI